MTFLPIVERELRLRARLKSTYRFRVGAAVVAIVIVGFLLLGTDGTSGGFGGGMFKLLGWLTFACCLLEGLRNTADCLSEEKRAGTLGLLFLTDLRGYDVVFGKLIATSLNSFYALLAVFPPMAIPLIIGGVTAGEFWRLVWLLVNTLFFSLAAGLVVSALSRDERKAWGGTLGLISFFAIIPPLLESVPGLPAILQLPFSPTSAMFALVDAEYTANPGRYWGALGSIHVLSWIFLVVASVVLPNSWHDRPEVTAVGWRRWLRAGGRKTAPVDDGAAFAARDAVLDVNPVIWLVARGERERLSLWTIIVVVGGLIAGTWVLAMGSSPVAIVLFVAVMLLHLGLALWVASEACHLFAEERDSGALEILLCTPLSIREVLDGYLMGLKRLFIRPVKVLLGVEALLLAGQIVVLWQNKVPDQRLLEIVFGVTICVAVSIMDLFAVARYGMWMGLSSKRPGQAVTKTVLRVLFLPLLALPFCFPLWPIVGLVKNLVFMNYAKEQLRRYFRAVVTERYGLGEETEVIGAPSKRARATQLPRVLPPG